MANSKNITFDQLQAALSRVKSALDGKANTSHGNHVPKTETANNARFLRNDNTWQTITPVNIGAADRSHSHGSYVNQNAFSNIKVGDTTVAADSPTDTLTLTAGANVTITPDATNDSVTIAAKDTVYTHPTTSGYKHIPSGGSSGQILRWSADGTAAWGSDNNTDTKVTNTLNTTAKAYVTGTTSATTNTGTQVFDTGVYLDTTAGKLVATTFAGALSGNASTATSLQTARKFTIGNTERTFNGSGDVKWTLADIGAAPVSHNHTSLTGITKLQFATESSDSANISTTVDESNTYFDFNLSDDPSQNDAWRWRFSPSGGTVFNAMTLDATSTTAANLTVSGSVIASSFSGNASSATKLQTARNIKIGNTTRSFNGTADVTWTLNDIGAAAASHGTHVTWSTTIPKANGTAAVGTETKVARGDHVHPAQTTVSGNAGTATKLQTARTLTIGNTGKAFDGSGNVSWTLSDIGAAPASHTHANVVMNNCSNKDLNTIKTAGFYYGYTGMTNAPVQTIAVLEVLVYSPDWIVQRFTVIGNGGKKYERHYYNGDTWSAWRTLYDSANKPTPADIGAAASNHGHSYLPLSGGTMTGNITFSDVNSTSYPANSSKITWNGSTDGADIYYRVTASDKGQLVLNLRDDADATIGIALNGSVKTTFDTNGYYSGKANQANTLATARTLTIGKTGKSFNGSGNVSWSLSEIGAAATSHEQDYAGTGTNTYIAYPKDGRYRTITDAHTGYLKITLPQSWTSTMMRFTIEVYNYASNSSFEVKVGGYNYSSNSSWINTFAYITAHKDSPYRNLAVRFGHDGTKCAVYIGESNTKWSYCQITVKDITVGYSAYELTKWNSGWSVGVTTTLGKITSTISNTFSANGGAARTADALATARTINGTSFNGSANITTANWGTARNIQIGNTSKSVNGSANVAWTLGEIGAAASNHTHGLVNLNSEAFSGGNDLNTYNSTKTWVARTLNSTTNKPADYFTVVNFGANSNSNFQLAHSYANNSTLYVRGRHDTSGNYTPWAKIYTDKNKPTASEIGAAAASHTHNYAGSSSAGGNANAAVKLATARSIGVTGAVSGSANFDGSGNISIITTYCYPTRGNFWNDGAMVVNADTGVAEAGIAIDFHLTSNTNDDYHTRLLCAGNNKNIVNLPTGNGTLALTSDNVASATKLQTARNIKIGNTSRSFNGTGDVTWTLSDIGAAAANHSHNYAASNHNHDSAYLKLSGGTLSGSLTVNNNVYSQGFCVSKNSKEVWLDIGDNDTYIWASGANKSLQITHSGDLNFDGKPVLYGGRGNNYDTATNTIYFNNAGASHKGRISCYKDGSNKDYVQTALRTASDTTNYVNIYEDTVKVGSNNIYLGGKKLTIATSAPSGPATGDVWINIG